MFNIWRWLALSDDIRAQFNAFKGLQASREITVLFLEKLLGAFHGMCNPRLIGDPSNPVRLRQRILAFIFGRLFQIKRHPVTGRALSLSEQLAEIRRRAADGLDNVEFIAEELLTAILIDVLKIPIRYLDLENLIPGYFPACLAHPTTGA